MDTVHIIASGPSSTGVKPAADYTVCVNGSYKLLDRPPMVLLIGEREAARVYKEDATRLHSDGGTRVIGSSYCKELLPCLEPISWELGPPHLHHLRYDVLGPTLPGKHGLPDNARAWISSGVLAMWWVLETLKPKTLIVNGIDGYPPRSAPARWQTGEYAHGVVPCERRPDRTDEYCEQFNWRCGEGIWAISNWYKDTKIYMASRHQAYNPGWRVTIGKP